VNNLNNIPEYLQVPEYLKKYTTKLEFAHTEALKLGHDVAGKVFRDGMHIVDKLDVAIDGNRWDEVKELEAKLDAICGPNLQRAALQIMLKHFAGLYDALCVLEDAALDEDGNHPDYISEIGTASLDLETVLMRCQYHFAAVSDDNDTLMEE
jgi:hypothetical protein